MKKTEYESSIEAILLSYKEIGGINHLEGINLPSRNSVNEILQLIKQILYPGYFESMQVTKQNIEYITGQKVVTVKQKLAEEIDKSLQHGQRQNKEAIDTKKSKIKSLKITSDFITELPEIRKKLKKDVSSIFKGDPAAKSEEEIILSYPGLQAITTYRIAHSLFKKDVPLIPRILTEIIHSETGIDIHPGAEIGEYFCIDHGTGIVVGESAIIGNHVKLYQGVTLGALSVNKNKYIFKRHPTIEDGVTIYARTTILGGETVIGKNSVIGGNLWITDSVAENSKIYLTSSDGVFKLRTK